MEYLLELTIPVQVLGNLGAKTLDLLNRALELRVGLGVLLNLGLKDGDAVLKLAALSIDIVPLGDLRRINKTPSSTGRGRYGPQRQTSAVERQCPGEEGHSAPRAAQGGPGSLSPPPRQFEAFGGETRRSPPHQRACPQVPQPGNKVSKLRGIVTQKESE